MRQLASILLALIAAVSAAWLPAAAAGPGDICQVFLVQNSGWMEPFYLDERSPLKLFLVSLIGKANLAGVPVVVASFNQDGQVAGRRSPDLLYEGVYDATRVADAVQRIDLPRKGSGAYADADFKGALSGTFDRLMHGRQGVIWMVTNNKDAPDNRAGVIENTQAFYNALRKSPYVTAIAAFPMRKLVSGPHFSERGLIFYAIAYGENGRRALSAILRDGAPVRSVFPSPPVKLKPLEMDPVELHLSSHVADVTASVVRGRLIVSGVSGGRPSTLRLQGDLRNTYYPQNIARAQMRAAWISSDAVLEGTKVRLDPEMLSNVPADGHSGTIELFLDLPAVRRSSGWKGIFEDERTAVGEIELRLDSLTFSLDPSFVERISAVSGGESLRADQAEAAMSARLPEMFLDYRRVSSASMRVPVQLTFRFSPWPLILLIAAGAVLLASLVAGAFIMSRARPYRVKVGSEERLVRLRPGERQVISDAYGIRAEARGRAFGPPFVKPLNDQ